MKKEAQLKYQSPLKELSLELPKEYQTVCCPSCDTDIPATDLNIHDKVGKCVSCNVLFPLQGTIQSLVHTPLSFQPKQTILRPEGIDVFQFRNELEFSFKRPVSEWSLLFLFLYAAFIPLPLTIAYFAGNGKMPILVPIFLWIPSLLSLYYLYFKKSTSSITIDDKQVTIQYRTKGRKRAQSYAVSDIDQLYIKKLSSQSGYSLHAIVDSENGSTHVTLIPLLKSHSKAIYLEQEIERHLGIIDREVTAVN